MLLILTSKWLSWTCSLFGINQKCQNTKIFYKMLIKLLKRNKNMSVFSIWESTYKLWLIRFGRTFSAKKIFRPAQHPNAGQNIQQLLVHYVSFIVTNLIKILLNSIVFPCFWSFWTREWESAPWGTCASKGGVINDLHKTNDLITA